MNRPTQPAECPCRELEVDVKSVPPGTAEFSGWVTRLVHAHRAHLVGLARHEGLGPEDAFDAVQEAFSAFLILPRARALVDAHDEARNMLAALTRNLARNARRLHAVARPHLSEAAALDAIADDAPAADQRLALAEDEGRLAGCVRRLADVQRAVVTLRMLEELPGEDVARLLGIKPGHVAVLLHRAKASLLMCMTNGSESPKHAEESQRQ